MYGRHAEADGNVRSQFTKVSIPAALGLALAALATLALGILPGHVLDMTNAGAADVVALPTAVIAPAVAVRGTP